MFFYEIISRGAAKLAKFFTAIFSLRTFLALRDNKLLGYDVIVFDDVFVDHARFDQFQVTISWHDGAG